jgi:hypothetical protein
MEVIRVFVSQAPTAESSRLQKQRSTQSTVHSHSTVMCNPSVTVRKSSPCRWPTRVETCRSVLRLMINSLCACVGDWCFCKNYVPAEQGTYCFLPLYDSVSEFGSTMRLGSQSRFLCSSKQRNIISVKRECGLLWEEATICLPERTLEIRV